MEDYELVEQFETAWRTVRRNVPLEERVRDKVVFSLYLAVGSLQMYLSLTVGPRGGIKEELVVIDPAPRIVADRLVTHVTDGGDADRGVFIPLPDLRGQVAQQPASKRREVAEVLCRAAMVKVAEELRQRPPEASRLRLRPSTSRSVGRILYGGSPGTGKFGGGRHG